MNLDNRPKKKDVDLRACSSVRLPASANAIFSWNKTTVRWRTRCSFLIAGSSNHMVARKLRAVLSLELKVIEAAG